MTEIEKLGSIITNMFHLSGKDAENIAGTVIAEFQANPLYYVKPKLLVWTDLGDDSYIAKCGIGEYGIQIKEGEMGYGFDIWMAGEDLDDYADHYQTTLELAKYAAYNHLCETLKWVF